MSLSDLRLTAKRLLLQACQIGSVSVVDQLMAMQGAFESNDINQVLCEESVATFVAAKYGHLPLLTALVENYAADIFVCDPKTGWSLAHVAAYLDHVHILQYLYQRDPRILTTTTPTGATAIFLAAQVGCLEALTFLLSIIPEMADVTRTSDACTPLFIAVQEGHFACAKAIARFVNANKTTLRGSTLLHAAVLQSHYDITCWLLETLHIPLTQRTSDGWSPLSVAAYHGKVEFIQLLLQQPCSEWMLVTADARGWLPLHISAHQGLVAATEVLATAALDTIDQQTHTGATPLLSAVQQGHVDVAKLLHRLGAEIPSQAMLWACQSGHLSVVEYLFEQNVSLTAVHDDVVVDPPALTTAHTQTLNRFFDDPLFGAVVHNQLHIVRWLIAHGAPVNIRASYGWTPLMEAAAENRIDMVKCLVLDGGADIDAIKDDGASALYLAAWRGHIEVVRFLLARGAIPQQSANVDMCPFAVAIQQGHEDVVRALLATRTVLGTSVDQSWSCLHVCAGVGNTQVARILIAAGAAVNCRMSGGFTPLHVAVWKNALPMVTCLIEEGSAAVDATNDDNASSLHIAAHENAIGCVTYLVEREADVNLRRQDGSTPLLVASRRGHNALAQYLLSAGADPNITDDLGWTPLLCAAWHGEASLVQKCIESGANVNHAQQNGATALYLACSNGHLAVAQYLVACGAMRDTVTKRGITVLQASTDHSTVNDWLRSSEGLTSFEVGLEAGLTDVVIRRLRQRMPGQGPTLKLRRPLQIPSQHATSMHLNSDGDLKILRDSTRRSLTLTDVSPRQLGQWLSRYCWRPENDVFHPPIVRETVWHLLLIRSYWQQQQQQQCENSDGQLQKYKALTQAPTEVWWGIASAIVWVYDYGS